MMRAHRPWPLRPFVIRTRLPIAVITPSTRQAQNGVAHALYLTPATLHLHNGGGDGALAYTHTRNTCARRALCARSSASDSGDEQNVIPPSVRNRERAGELARKICKRP